MRGRVWFKPRPHSRLLFPQLWPSLSPSPKIDGETGLREDKGHIQAPETPSVSHQDSTRPCSCIHLLCPAQDVGFCPSISWDCHSHSWEETRGHPPSSDIPQMVNKERLPALPSERMAHSFHRAPSTDNDYGPPTALAPGRRHCFSDMPGTLPAILGQNHRMAGPQESACLKESNRCAAHAQDPEGLWE